MILKQISKSWIFYSITQIFIVENHQSSDKIDDNLQIAVGYKCQKFWTKRKILELITAKENVNAGTQRKTNFQDGASQGGGHPDD